MFKKENFMSIAEAKAFVSEVCAIVEREDNGYCDYQTYQNRQNGAVFGEGVRVDTDFDTAHGSFIDYVGICYYVNRQDYGDGGLACIRRLQYEEGRVCTDTPFHGSVQEAADYLLKEYRESYD